jgi:hypothetical protein
MTLMVCTVTQVYFDSSMEQTNTLNRRSEPAQRRIPAPRLSGHWLDPDVGEVLRLTTSHPEQVGIGAAFAALVRQRRRPMI